MKCSTTGMLKKEDFDVIVGVPVDRKATSANRMVKEIKDYLTTFYHEFPYVKVSVYTYNVTKDKTTGISYVDNIVVDISNHNADMNKTMCEVLNARFNSRCLFKEAVLHG